MNAKDESILHSLSTPLAVLLAEEDFTGALRKIALGIELGRSQFERGRPVEGDDRLTRLVDEIMEWVKAQ